MLHTKQTGSLAGKSLEFATFYVGDMLLGLSIEQVDEINRHLHLTPVPHAPPYVGGVINLRGEVVTVIDLRTVLGLPPAEINKDSRNVIVRFRGERVGLLVDRVADVVNVAAEEMIPPPSNLGGLEGAFFVGVYRLPEELLVVLCPEAVFAGEER